jgi:hypothetical protein
MNKFRFIISALAIATFTFAFASISQAQSRTWVSGLGNDADPCSRTAPCRTFSGAYSKTAVGGEINVLDGGGYGTLTITDSITINGIGSLAGNLASGLSGFTINAPLTAKININNVSINGNSAAGGFHGIRILQAGSVNLEDLGIYNFTGDGISIIETSSVKVSINRVTIKDCTGAGIRADTSAGIARVNVRQTQVTNCGLGLNARRNSRMTIIDSTFALNSLGVHVEGNGGTAVAVLENCQITNNTGIGIQAGGGAATNNSVARISNNTINNNAGSGISIQANGAVESFLNNKIVGNNPDGCAGCVSLSGNIN